MFTINLRKNISVNVMKSIFGIKVNAFLIVENMKFLKMENVFANRIIFIIKVNVHLVHLTLGLQKIKNNVFVRIIIIGTLIRIRAII